MRWKVHTRVSANVMDQAGYPGVSLEQKWKGEWEMFGGLSRAGKGLLGVSCWAHAGADVRVDGVGDCVACWEGRWFLWGA